MSDTTIPIHRFWSDGAWHTLYYYNGNFFYPVFMAERLRRVVMLRIKQFKRENAELVRSDRAHPDYKDKVQLSGL